MPKETTSFTKTPIEVISSMPRLTPEQQAHKDVMEKAKMGGRPVGGIPPVRIPPLDADPLPGGGSMSAQADALSDPTNPLSPAYSPELAQMAARGTGPFATLPPEAARDPNFRPGVGSMISANQPQLRQQAAPSGEPRKPVLRQETVSDLQKLAEFQKTAESIQEQELKAAEAAAAKQAEEDILKGPAPYQGDLDQEDWNILNNPARRKDIESRLAPLGIEDIIIYGEIQQEVEVVPGKTRYKFRSTTGEEDLAVKRMMFGESGGDRYMLDKFSLYNLTLGVVSINNMALPTHLNDKKRFDESLFLKKYETLMRFPVQLLGDMAVQYMWFDQRVRRLFVKSAEELKNS
jgi:hypothetical protein